MELNTYALPGNSPYRKPIRAKQTRQVPSLHPKDSYMLRINYIILYVHHNISHHIHREIVLICALLYADTAISKVLINQLIPNEKKGVLPRNPCTVLLACPWGVIEKFPPPTRPGNLTIYIYKSR